MSTAQLTLSCDRITMAEPLHPSLHTSPRPLIRVQRVHVVWINVAPPGRFGMRVANMVEIHLYGKVRKYAPESASPGTSTLNIEPDTDETIQSLLARLEIPTNEVNHIFYNSKLLVSRSKAAAMFDLPQVGKDTMNWDLAVPVSSGDRLGVFGLDIPVLSM